MHRHIHVHIQEMPIMGGRRGNQQEKSCPALWLLDDCATLSSWQQNCLTSGKIATTWLRAAARFFKNEVHTNRPSDSIWRAQHHISTCGDPLSSRSVTCAFYCKATVAPAYGLARRVSNIWANCCVCVGRRKQFVFQGIHHERRISRNCMVVTYGALSF
jgi:hypothetical protein